MSRDYYDRKVARADQVAMFATMMALIAAACAIAASMFLLLSGNNREQEMRLEIHECLSADQRAVMLSDETIECREKSNGMPGSSDSDTGWQAGSQGTGGCGSGAGSLACSAHIHPEGLKTQ